MWQEFSFSPCLSLSLSGECCGRLCARFVVVDCFCRFSGGLDTIQKSASQPMCGGPIGCFSTRCALFSSHPKPFMRTHTHKHGKKASKQATPYKSTGNRMGLSWLMSLFFSSPPPSRHAPRQTTGHSFPVPHIHRVVETAKTPFLSILFLEIFSSRASLAHCACRVTINSLESGKCPVMESRVLERTNAANSVCLSDGQNQEAQPP